MPRTALPAAENFSRNLQTLKVRAFIPDSTDPLSNRHYLSLSRVDVGAISARSGPHCPADPDDATQITAVRCPTLVTLLPTFNTLSPDATGPALWELTLADASDPNNARLDQSATVFVEFTVLNPAGQQTGPRIDPAQYDLGFVPFQGSTRRAGRAFGNQ